jgi:hypothetical protein
MKQGRYIEEMRWLDDHRESLEASHPGRWVAISGYELIALGDSLDEVMDEAARKGVLDPLVAGIRNREFQGVTLVRPWR